MTVNKLKIRSGLYLVVDPSMEEDVLLKKLQASVNKGLAVVQLWDHFPEDRNKEDLVRKVSALCHEKNIPVLINNRWEYLLRSPLDGIHFDGIPDDLEEIKKKVNKPLIYGITCGNDLSVVHWAHHNRLDYISFCSMFPSSSTGSCELVKHETVLQAKKIFDNPVFLAGGIKPDNLKELEPLDYDGIAVISGIMSSKNPSQSVLQYMENFKIK